MFYRKVYGHWVNFVEYQKSLEYQKSKGKNVNKLLQKLCNMSKVSLREKEAYDNK